MASARITFEQRLDDMSRRRGSYLAIFAAAPSRMWVAAVINVGIPVIALGVLLAGDGARALGFVVVWLLGNRWLDLRWRWRIARMRRKPENAFGRAATVELDGAGVRVVIDGAVDHARPWSAFQAVGEHRGIVGLALDANKALTLVPSPPIDAGEVVAMAVANGVRPWQPNAVLFFFAIGPA